jgi:hypothetical protein
MKKTFVLTFLSLAAAVIAFAAPDTATPPAVTVPPLAVPAATKPAPAPPSAELKAVGAFFDAAKAAAKTPAAYAATSDATRAAFASALANAEAIRTKDGRTGRATAYALFVGYEAYLASGNATFDGVETPNAFRKRTDAGRYWRTLATADELLANKRLAWPVRYDSAKRFDRATRIKTQNALFLQGIGTGNIDGRFTKWLRAHVATLPDAEATAILKKEIALLAVAPASKARDAAVNDYIGILAIRRELASVK